MSQTVITAAFESWKAQEAAGCNRVVLDGFVLAYVPGLDPDAPVSNTEGLPPDSQIVYRQDVDKCGVVNNNSVVYSITMGSNVGTFDFNWIGLVNKASGVLAMIVHTPVQRKLKTEDGQQGNAINRSFLMEYDGAATETEINTPAQTWQIDFTARLSGMDEEWRMANFDIYGQGAFFGDGFLVKKDGSKYQVLAGSGYIGGVRATMSASEEITADTLPAKVFADVSWQGALTGRWQAVTTVQASTAEITDYIDGDGFAHYVFAVASIDDAGAVTDLRPIGSIPAQVADGAIKTITAGNNTHKPGATGDVKLGSAADADIVISMTDTTTERVPVVGWMGTGGPEIPIPDGTDIYKYFATAASGNYGGGGNLVNKLTSSGWVSFKWQQHGSDKRYGVLFEQSSIGQMALHIYNNQNGDMTSPEKYWSNSGLLFSEKNPPTAAQCHAMPYFGTALSVDLNTLGPYSAAGVYYQPANAGATTADHYPVSEAGTLLVTPGAYGCQQEYTTFSSRRKFIRGLSSAWKDSGPWQDWNELYGPTNPNEIVSTSANSYRIAYNGYGAFWRQDGIHLYLMLTNKADPLGNYNALRPLYVDMATGYPVMSRLSLSDYTNFDERYLRSTYAAIQGWRWGAKGNANNGNGGGNVGAAAPNGAAVVTVYQKSDWSAVDYRYAQYLYNGTWYNAGVAS